MPYIDKHERDLIDHSADFTSMSGLNQFIKKVDKLRDSVSHSHMATHPGTLNYIITRLCDYWCRDYAGEANYEKYNTVIGVLECVKQELYRRQIAPYEDEKCKENGDVYDQRIDKVSLDGSPTKQSEGHKLGTPTKHTTFGGITDIALGEEVDE